VINSKGQFFSPDILIAVLVFLLSIFLFLNASTFVFSQVNLYQYRTSVDEIAHATMNSLVSSGGVPVNWNTKDIENIRFFGIAKSDNILDKNKTLTLIDHLDNNYIETKKILGLGSFDFKLNIINKNGSVIYESNVTTEKNIENELIYSRRAILDGEIVLIEGVVLSE
jgi:hypothetical protein